MARRPGDAVGVLVLRAWTETEEPHFRARLTSVLNVEEDDACTVAVATPDEALTVVAAWLGSFSDRPTVGS
jgi:hypothetical protein